MPRRAAPRIREVPATVTERLAIILDWYKGMISEKTGRLIYTYDADSDVAIGDGSPIRDIASVWDVELLSHFLSRSDLLPLVERSIQHYSSYLIRRDSALILDPERLGEPSGIAHSAFMILALCGSDFPGRQEKIFALVDGILRQQREDGSYRVYFGDEEDEGLEFYPGEAMLALMQAYSLFHDARHMTSVERGFAYQKERFPANAIDLDFLVFYANWQSQYAEPLHVRARADALKRAVRDYVFALHDRILQSGFYEDIERNPMRQGTVEVACALEGLNDAHTIAGRERDVRRMSAYERAIRIALGWLFRAQSLEHCTWRERGGFGHSLINRVQRIDITGHVLSGFIKSVRNGIDTPA